MKRNIKKKKEIPPPLIILFVILGFIGTIIWALSMRSPEQTVNDSINESIHVIKVNDTDKVIENPTITLVRIVRIDAHSYSSSYVGKHTTLEIKWVKIKVECYVPDCIYICPSGQCNDYSEKNCTNKLTTCDKYINYTTQPIHIDDMQTDIIINNYLDSTIWVEFNTK